LRQWGKKIAAHLSAQYFNVVPGIIFFFFWKKNMGYISTKKNLKNYWPHTFTDSALIVSCDHLSAASLHFFVRATEQQRGLEMK
jgi:hypothetical protein